MNGETAGIETPQREGLTFRALFLGVLFVLFISIGAPYSLYVIHSTMWAISYLPFSVMFFFFLLVMGNAALARLRPMAALTRTELVAIFIMGLVGASIPTWGTTSYLISVIASPNFFASPENRWAETILPYLPSWIAPSGGDALRWFFEGLPPGETIPWGDWLVPLFWWTGLVLDVFLLSHFLVAAFRRQWVENERLTFPLMQVADDMTEYASPTRRWPAFLENRVFWIGFAIPFFMVMWNIISYFHPDFPSISNNWGRIALGRGFPAIVLVVNFAVVGFTFLIHLNVAFSIWFFVLLSMIEEGVFNGIGYHIPGRDVYTLGPPPIGWQSFGALCVMVINLFWTGRKHLWAIARNAIRPGSAGPDQDEILSHRTIAVGLFLSLAYLFAWLCCSGMSFLVTVLFIGAMLVLYVGITRIVVESGLLFIRGPLIPQTFTAFALGPGSVSAQSLAAMGIHYSWMHELKGFFMPAACHAAKLGDSMRGTRRAVTLCVLVAAVAATVASMWFTLYMGYQRGALHFGGWIFGRGAEVPYDEVARKMTASASPDWPRLSFLGAGAGAMALLLFLHYRFSWWPVHPIGLPVAICSYPMTHYVFSIFLGWLVKTITLWLGGNRAYQRVRPFFMGVILGFFTAVGVSFLVDVLWFPGEGHVLYGD